MKFPKNFAPYLFVEASNITSVIAGSMVFIALPWLSLELTGSATSAGLLVAITAIPGLLLSPILGTIIDRIGRRISTILSDGLAAITTLLIPIAHNYLEFSFVLLVALALLRSIVGPAGTTSRKSIIPDVATPAGLSLERANSIHEAVFATGFAIGPAVGALFIALIGPYDVFIVCAVFSFIAAFFAYLVRTTESRGDGISETGSLLKDTALGVTTIWKTPSVRLGMGFILTLAMIYLPTEIVVLPAHFNLLDYAAGLGILISTMAGASVIGSLSFEKLQKHLRYSTILKFGFVGVGSSMLLMSLLPPFGVMLALGAVLGFSWGPLMPMINTVIQRIIPDKMRGRVFGIEMTIWQGGPMISSVVVGLAVDGFGVPPVYLMLAVLVLGMAIFISFNKDNASLDHAQQLASV